MGSQFDKQNKVLSQTILSYLSSLQAYQVDNRIFLEPFKKPLLSSFIKKGKRSFLHTKAVCLPIIRKILLKTTRHQMFDGKKMSIEVVFKVAQACFVHISKITSTTTQQVAVLSQDTQVTRADISFSGIDWFVILKLKTNINYNGILIIVKETQKQNCTLRSIHKLIFRDFQLADTTFYSQTKEALSRKYLIDQMKSYFAENRIDARNYSGYNIRDGVEQHKLDCKRLNKNIQKQRQLMSNAF